MRALVFLAALLLPATLLAQSTERDLEARLLDKPLYLRGLWQDNKLHFDAAGQLQKKSKTTTFTLAGMDVVLVELKPDHLHLEGWRRGLLFDPAGTHFIALDNIKIDIAAPTNGDYGPALDAIFSRLSEMIPSLPDIWKIYATQHLTHVASEWTTEEPPKEPHPKFDFAGTQAPVVVFAPAPGYNGIAREKRIGGSVLVYLVVDSTGRPTQIRILRPVGMGLDEQAAIAVSQYKFKAAVRDGSPVAVEMNVEVNFQVF